MDGNQITICKIGADHLKNGTPKQDCFVSLPNLSVVLDGCGSEPFSQIGAALFAQLLAEYSELITVESFKEVVNGIFSILTNIQNTDSFNLANLQFTIVACLETEDEFVVMSCGDGYILTTDGIKVTPIILEENVDPSYYICNYVIDKSILVRNRDGVDFTIAHFSKKEYANVGVATDGFRFVEQLSGSERELFFQYLLEGRKGKVAQVINRNQGVFKDDIAICF